MARCCGASRLHLRQHLGAWERMRQRLGACTFASCWMRLEALRCIWLASTCGAPRALRSLRGWPQVRKLCGERCESSQAYDDRCKLHLVCMSRASGGATLRWYNGIFNSKVFSTTYKTIAIGGRIVLVL